MYKIFKLPSNFLHHTYTDEESKKYDEAILNYYNGDSSALTEELDPAQKKKVDMMWGPDSSAREAHSAVFGGKDRIVIPYDDSQSEKITSINAHRLPIMRNVGNDYSSKVPHRVVINHLSENGYHVDDYGSGLAAHKDTPTRKIKISAALKSSGISDMPSGIYTKAKTGIANKELTLAQAYETDPVRAASKKEKHIVITKNKYDVAGMSTNRGWTSCMNLSIGSNRHFVKHDISHGTLTAYLCTKDDAEASRPIGRVNLKKFTHVATGHTIYQPEQSIYGTVPSNFHSTVSEWAEKNYAPKDAGIYAKESSLYDDDGKSIKTHNLHELDSEKQLHKNTAGLLASRLSRYRDGYDPKIEDNHGSVGDITEQTLTDHHREIGPKAAAHSILHWVADHSSENFGDRPKDFDDLDADDIHSNTPLHSWACDNIRKHFKHGVDEFNASDSMIGLDKIHNSIGKNTTEDHEHLNEVHGRLIDHVFSHSEPEWDAAKSHIVNHMADEDNVDYYFHNRDHRVSDHSSKLNNYPLATLTKNPRQIHKILELENDHLDESSVDGRSYGLEHIAKNADVKLAHHIYMENKNVPGSKIGSFTRSLNTNDNSEEIQHELLNPMHLHTDDVDDEYVDRHKDMIHAIAENTPHKSVFDRIKARTNTDLSFAKRSLKLNPHLSHTMVMESYLRFLK